MKFFTSLFATFIPMCGLMSMPVPDFQDTGTVNLSFCSSGDIGATIGVFNEQNIKSEVEVDYNIKEHSSVALAGKVGFDECIYSEYSPSFAVGVFNAQIKSRHETASNGNVYYALTGKSYKKGKLHVGVFHGNWTMGTERKGIFIGYTQHLIVEDIDETHKRSKLDLYGEYITGKSSLAGAKVEMKYLISEKMNIKFGPSWQFYRTIVQENPLIPVVIPKKWSFDNVKWLLTFSVNI